MRIGSDPTSRLTCRADKQEGKIVADHQTGIRFGWDWAGIVSDLLVIANGLFYFFFDPRGWPVSAA